MYNTQSNELDFLEGDAWNILNFKMNFANENTHLLTVNNSWTNVLFAHIDS